MEEITCDNCNNTFMRYRCKIKRAKNHYCSVKCARSSVTKLKLKNYFKCKNCEKFVYKQPIQQKRSANYFCSRSCSAKSQIGKHVTKQTRKKISISLNNWLKKNPTSKSMSKSICQMCQIEFEHPSYDPRKTCSMKCKNNLQSKRMINKIIENGVSNKMTKKREQFTHKNIINIPTDSKLEKAAIIYLIDNFQADKIQRSKHIIEYIDHKGKQRLFNPDFVVQKNDKKFIVEVKMKMGATTHEYNALIPGKKLSLINYCKKYGYEMIWLDFDYDKNFKKIYRKHLETYRK